MANKDAVSYVVGSKVKDFWGQKDLRLGGETLDALNQRVEELLDAAASRCKRNGRATVRPEDL
jgi:histone H3/H4